MPIGSLINSGIEDILDFSQIITNDDTLAETECEDPVYTRPQIGTPLGSSQQILSDRNYDKIEEACARLQVPSLVNNDVSNLKRDRKSVV